MIKVIYWFVYVKMENRKHCVYTLQWQCLFGDSFLVDINNNINTDNRIENLRLITQRKNSSKDKKNGTSEFTGVNWSKQAKKWASQIHINGKKKHLGYFTNEIDAHLAYQEALSRIK